MSVQIRPAMDPRPSEPYLDSGCLSGGFDPVAPALYTREPRSGFRGSRVDLSGLGDRLEAPREGRAGLERDERPVVLPDAVARTWIPTIERMAIQRMDHVGVVVDDLASATEFGEHAGHPPRRVRRRRHRRRRRRPASPRR